MLCNMDVIPPDAFLRKDQYDELVKIDAQDCSKIVDFIEQNILLNPDGKVRHFKGCPLKTNDDANKNWETLLGIKKREAKAAGKKMVEAEDESEQESQ